MKRLVAKHWSGLTTIGNLRFLIGLCQEFPPEWRATRNAMECALLVARRRALWESVPIDFGSFKTRVISEWLLITNDSGQIGGRKIVNFGLFSGLHWEKKTNRRKLIQNTLKKMKISLVKCYYTNSPQNERDCFPQTPGIIQWWTNQEHL